MKQNSTDVVIIGAGLAGLTCAAELIDKGIEVTVVEAAPTAGGRVRTDHHEGFLLDHGFQVLLTAYPTAQKYLDYKSLDLRSFYPGAIIKGEGFSEKMADPFRRPLDGIKTVMSPVGSAKDKLLIGQLRTAMIGRSLEKIYQGKGMRSFDWLKDEGYSDTFITQFFKPFYGGVMLDRDLETSHKMLEFTYKMFAAGDTAVPAKGMGQLTAQLAARIPEGHLLLNTPVKQIKKGEGIELENGDTIHANQIVVATDMDFAREHVEGIPQNTWRGVRCLYFAAPTAPEDDPILVLNGEERGPMNNLCVMSKISPEYGTKDEELISISVLGEGLKLPEDELINAVKNHAISWYGRSTIEQWRHLKTYDIHKGQPDQSDQKLDEIFRDVRFGEELFVCGDHRETASIEGAMHSGQRTAEAIINTRST